jgi:Na+/melibiose symporter-like transporter
MANNALENKSVVGSQGEHPRLFRWALLIGAGVLSTTLSQPSVLRLPFQNLLKSDLHVSREAMATFFAIIAVAWNFKPLAGILTDSVPLFGTRRKHYLILSAIIAAAFYLLVGVVPHTYYALLIILIAVNAMLVVGSTVVGGIMVEIGQRNRATGRLSSARYVVQNLCILIGGPLSGFLAIKALGLTAIVGAVVSFSVVPIAWRLLREPPVARNSKTAWTKTKEQFRTLMRSGSLWSAAGLLFLVYIAPGFGTPLYYFQTDTLKLSQPFIGTLIFIAGAGGIVGTALYAVLCQRLPLRWMLFLGIGVSVLGTLCYLFYRSATAAALIEAENGFVGTLAELGLMDLAARATPRGSEGLGFAIMMSVRNGGLALSDIFGSWLIDQHHVTFFKLVWLNAATTAIILMIIPFLPRALIDQHDARSGAS